MNKPKFEPGHYQLTEPPPVEWREFVGAGDYNFRLLDQFMSQVGDSTGTAHQSTVSKP